MSTWQIMQLAREGRISPHDAAVLIELRRELRLRRSRWYRIVRWLQRWLP